MRPPPSYRDLPIHGKRVSLWAVSHVEKESFNHPYAYVADTKDLDAKTVREIFRKKAQERPEGKPAAERTRLTKILLKCAHDVSDRERLIMEDGQGPSRGREELRRRSINLLAGLGTLMGWGPLQPLNPDTHKKSSLNVISRLLPFSPVGVFLL